MLPKKFAGKLTAPKAKGKLKKKLPPAPVPPQVQGPAPALKPGASKKLKGMS